MRRLADSVSARWKSVAEAVAEVIADEAAGAGADGAWWNPTDPKWWAECPQIGTVDANACASKYGERRRYRPKAAP